MILANTFDLEYVMQLLNDYSSYIPYIFGALMIGLDLLVVLGALIYMGLGFAFGTRKSLRRLLTFSVPFIILILLVDPVSKLITNSAFALITSEYGEIAVNYLEEYIASYGYSITFEISEFSKTIQLANSITFTVVRFSIFVIGLLIILLVITPLTRYITWLTYRVQTNGKKNPKVSLASRFGGMAIASLRYIFVLILVVVPINGVISTTSLLIKDASIILNLEEEGEVKTNEIIQTSSDVLEEISEGLNYSLIRQFFKQSANESTGVSVDMAYLGQFVEITVEEDKLNIFEEYGMVRKIFPIANKVINIVTEENFDPVEIINRFDVEDVDGIRDMLQGLGTIKLIMPVTFEVGYIALEKTNLMEEFGIDLSPIKEIDINKDYDLIVDASSIILRAVVAQDLEFETVDELIDNIMNNEVLNKELKTFINDILDTDTVSKIGLPMAVSYINTAMDELNKPELDELQKLLTLENIEDCLRNDISSVFEITKTLYDSDLKILISALINGEDIKNLEIDFSSSDLKEAVTSAIEKIMELKMIHNHEETLIKALVSLATQNDLNLDEVLYDENGNKLINWSNETGLLVEALFEIISIVGLDLENIDVELLKEKLIFDKEARERLVDIIAASEIVRHVGVRQMPRLLNESGVLPGEFSEFFTAEKFEELRNKEKFSSEIKLLMGILSNIFEVGLLDFETFTLNSENKEIIKITIKDLLNSHFIIGQEEQLIKLFIEKTNFSVMLAENGIILDYSKVTDWHKEIENIVDIAVEFFELSTEEGFDLSKLFEANMPEEDINKVANLFEKVAESELFKPIIYQLIDKVGYEIEITEEDKVKIEANGWNNEIKSLLTILGDAQGLLEDSDLSKLEGAQVEKLMIDASIGIITSKVVGNILTTALGPDGLNINTVDENGNSKYDFTDPNVLKTEAKNVANLIDLANGLSNVDLENADSITVVTDALTNLENNELAQDFVKEIVGEDVNLEEVSKDADIIQSVYEEYQNAEDKENFTIDPESEIGAKLEDSELAKAILEMMGIIK